MKKLHYYIFILFVLFTSCQAKKAQNRTNTNISVSIDSSIYYTVHITKVNHRFSRIEVKKNTKNTSKSLYTAFYNSKGKLFQTLLAPIDSGSISDLSCLFQDGRIKYAFYYDIREKTEKYTSLWVNKEFFQFDKKGNLVGFYLIEDGKLKNLIYANPKSFNIFLKDFKNNKDLTIDSVWYNKKFETTK